MNRQYQDPSNICCCGRNKHRYELNCKYIQQRDSSEDEDEYHNYHSSKHNNCHIVDDHQSWKTTSTLRQKACQYTRSETEEAVASDPLYQQCTYPDENQYGNLSLMRRANDLIDYAPESEFLRKIKQQCQYLQNCQPNIFSTIDDIIENDVSSYECQKCTDSSDPVSRRREQLNTDRIKSLSEKSWKCTCNQYPNATSANNDHFSNAQKVYQESKIEQMKEKKQKTDKSINTKNKSEHISRSKKPAKCRGRRKRKSVSSECESEDQFEPTLKKPHENSCERCWRFASPSRSPVNKPDQRYDPNFRRGHSYMDFNKGNGDISDKDSQCENSEPITSREKERSPIPQNYTQHRSQSSPSPSLSVKKDQCSVVQPPMFISTKVKELLNEEPCRKPKEKYLPSMRPLDDSQLKKTGMPECHGILFSDLDRKPRPKSYTPGLSSPDMSRCLNDRSGYNSTEYKTICMNPRKHCFNSSEATKTPKPPVNVMPPTYKETCVTSKECSPGRPCDHSSLKTIPEAEAVSSKQNKSDTLKVPLPKTAKNLDEHETPKAQVETPKNLKTPAPKKTAKPEPKKPKTNQKPTSTKPKNVQLEKKPPKKYPQTPKSQTTDKHKCPQDIRENVCGDDKEKYPSTASSEAKEYHYNPHPNCGNTFEHRKSSHPIRDCSCYPRISRSKNSPSNQDGHIFCCHCDWEENHNSQTNRQSCKSSDGVRPIYGAADTELNERRFMKNPHSRSGCYNCTHRSSSPESNFVQSPRDYSGKTLSCPYRDFMGSKMPLRSSNTLENNRSSICENQYRPPKEHRKTPEDQDPFPPGCSPRKYFVFYMTKSKENKKGDDVEVLVEEFGQTGPDTKNTRTKDIAEKMKKILECPSDSMALRFQKGVSETCKTPPSSRILYF